MATNVAFATASKPAVARSPFSHDLLIIQTAVECENVSFSLWVALNMRRCPNMPTNGHIDEEIRQRSSLLMHFDSFVDFVRRHKSEPQDVLFANAITFLSELYAYDRMYGNQLGTVVRVAIDGILKRLGEEDRPRDSGPSTSGQNQYSDHTELICDIVDDFQDFYRWILPPLTWMSFLLISAGFGTVSTALSSRNFQELPASTLSTLGNDCGKISWTEVSAKT
ncbi:hypothetical protein L596_019671 [Steinernema carpocapsae]|uniref:Uncharacterized protein n=1 Tax=Steinernema carpocapsae TaxID=34508 RepID=A0A4U5MR79_STECR|nr:hypothetical protein L596_019671 [Steinernema carpocapsae]